MRLEKRWPTVQLTFRLRVVQKTGRFAVLIDFVMRRGLTARMPCPLFWLLPSCWVKLCNWPARRRRFCCRLRGAVSLHHLSLIATAAFVQALLRQTPTAVVITIDVTVAQRSRDFDYRLRPVRTQSRKHVTFSERHYFARLPGAGQPSRSMFVHGVLISFSDAILFLCILPFFRRSLARVICIAFFSPAAPFFAFEDDMTVSVAIRPSPSLRPAANPTAGHDIPLIEWNACVLSIYLASFLLHFFYRSVQYASVLHVRPR